MYVKETINMYIYFTLNTLITHSLDAAMYKLQYASKIFILKFIEVHSVNLCGNTHYVCM